MAAREITVVKQKYQTGDGTDLFLSNKIKVEADANGKYVPGSAVTTLSLHDTGGNILGDVKEVATRGADGIWVLKKDGNGNPVAGLDLQKSLANRNSMLNVNLNNHIKQSMGAPLQGVPAGQVNNNTPQAVAAAIGIGTNTASSSGVPIDGAAISKAVGVKEGTRNKFPGAAGEKPIVYPITLKNELQDVIKFSMIQYRPKTYSSDKFGYGERTRLSPTIEDGKVSGKDTQIIGTVVLPIPNGISDSNAVTWGGADSNAAQAAIGSVVSGSITNGVSGGADAIGNLVKTVYKNTPEVQAAITGLFVDNATQQQGFLARTAGLIINPNLELLFSAPTLRPFNFTFKLASRSPKESETIRSIIRFFKQGMSPIRSQSNLFLKAPHTFQIQYLHRGGEHKFLNKFKECALTNFSVSYTPEGQYATFNDGAMVSYSITMQFSELEPVFNDDYTALDQNEDTEIGF
jgi:hypothetical protein